MNYWGKVSTRIWKDILMLTFLQSRKRNDPSVVCFVLQVFARKPTQGFFCKLVQRSQLIANYWPHFAEVIECLLMFLLNVLLDLNDELDLFCRSFAIQNIPASLHSILTYQIKFPPPHPPLLLNLRVLKSRLIWICKILYWCSLFLF